MFIDDDRLVENMAIEVDSRCTGQLCTGFPVLHNVVNPSMLRFTPSPRDI